MSSDKFIKYVSIENHYQEGFIYRCPTGNYEWCITEKIHGSNFQVYYDGINFLIGSRNRFLNSDDKFCGLQDLVEKIKSKILDFYYEYSYDRPFVLTLYGEVYGDGIQKGIKYCKDHKIRFFDIKINNDYVPYKTAIDIFNKYELPYIPVKELYFGRLCNAVNRTDTRFNSTVAEGEYKELEDNLCEGVVIKPYEVELKSQKGDRVIIKKKNEEFWEKAHAPKAKIKDDRFVDFKTDENAVMVYINQNRFDSVFSKDNYQKNNFGDFIKAYTEDVVEDANKDNIEFKNLKNIHNIVAKSTKVEYFNRVA